MVVGKQEHPVTQDFDSLDLRHCGLDLKVSTSESKYNVFTSVA
jgi:hypothetical protein